MRHLAPDSLKFTTFLGFVAGLPALSIDLSAPTLAILPGALGTTVFVAGLSLSLFLLGFGIGQFVGGRNSDQFGRRPVLIAALSIYIFAGLCCSIATSGGQLATARLIQGIGAGACSVQAYAIVQDLFAGEKARRKQAYVSVTLTLMPMLAPAIGALILFWSNWRFTHATLALGGLALLVVVIRQVAESNLRCSDRGRGGLGMPASLELLREDGFRQLVTVNAFSYASIFLYIAGAPVVIIGRFGYGNSVYAAIFACTAAALSAGAMTSARLATRLSTATLVGPALMTQALTNLVLVAATMVSTRTSAWICLPLLVVSCFARGIVAPNLVHAAVSSHREQAGLAASLLGLAQLCMAAVASGILARLLDRYGAVSVSTGMALLAGAAVLVWWSTGLSRRTDHRPS